MSRGRRIFACFAPRFSYFYRWDGEESKIWISERSLRFSSHDLIQASLAEFLMDEEWHVVSLVSLLTSYRVIDLPIGRFVPVVLSPRFNPDQLHTLFDFHARLIRRERHANWICKFYPVPTLGTGRIFWATFLCTLEHLIAIDLSGVRLKWDMEIEI